MNNFLNFQKACLAQVINQLSHFHNTEKEKNTVVDCIQNQTKQHESILQLHNCNINIKLGNYGGRYQGILLFLKVRGEEEKSGAAREAS